MKGVFEIVEALLSANTADLIELAEIAGYDPRVMYLGTDLSDLDLSGQNKLLLYDLGFVPTVAQKAKLESPTHEENVSEPETSKTTRQLISELRSKIILDYLGEVFGTDNDLSSYNELLEPLNLFEPPARVAQVEDDYAMIALRFIWSTQSNFDNYAEQQRFFKAMRKARFPLDGRIVSEIAHKAPRVLKSRTFLDTFEVEECSSSFLITSLKFIKAAEPGKIKELAVRIIESLDAFSLELAAFFVSTGLPNHVCRLLLEKLNDNGTMFERTELSKALVQSARDAQEILDFAKQLNAAPTIRSYFVELALRSRSSALALAALKLRMVPGSPPLSAIGLSDATRNLDGFLERLAFANGSERLLPEHLHRAFVLETAATFSFDARSGFLRKRWPRYFSAREISIW